MLGKRTSESEQAVPIVAELPPGYDDEDSKFFVPANLRADYQAVDVRPAPSPTRNGGWKTN